ncbi:hypothetical protein [Streptomyces sp. NPDC020298]|uniref:hypothetical protein n=1 Tax=unclassified Streptomyces TaxID=2593676 RepID=UPI0034060C48
MSRLAKRRQVNHKETAEALRRSPGVWLIVGEYRNRSTASSTSYAIRAATPGVGAWYAPPDSFESRTELVEEGVRVYARYVGTRRDWLLAAIRAAGQPITTHDAELLLADSPWPTAGRNTVRKDLRGLARNGRLDTGTTATGRRLYIPKDCA